MTWSTRPLADEDLAAIRARSPSADTRTLLWEIRRLRAIVLRADELQRALGEVDGPAGAALTLLRADLRDEPCVEERERRKRRWADVTEE